MDKNEIDNMPAGNEIDTLVAKKLGWLPQAFSTEISSAWEVAESLRLFVAPFGINEWCCADRREKNLALHIIGIAPSAPLAICRAVLNAVLNHEL